MLSFLKRLVLRIPAVGPLLRQANRRRIAEPRESVSVSPEIRPDVDFLRTLSLDPTVAESGSEHEALPRFAFEPAPSFPDRDLCFVTVCTTNHVPFARALRESVRRHHDDALMVVVVVDARARHSVDPEGAVILTGADIFGSDLDYYALKFNASELCCVAKPHALEYVLRNAPSTRLVYLDSDIYLFAPLEAMLTRLDRADFVITPHMFTPMPWPERFWERPSLGDVAHEGVFNAGMFALRRGEAAEQFVATWKSMVSAPGTFVSSENGGQTEQNAFNWLPCFADSVAILRDPSYNVAYWNLHERLLRSVSTEHGAPQFTVNGQPLVAFHFSGFPRTDRTLLTRHDRRRFAAYVLPAIDTLCEYYRERTAANDAGELGRDYPFAAFASGIPIDDRIRGIFRTHEDFLRSDINPWTPEGESYYACALLSPIPYTGSMVPILLQKILALRPDVLLPADTIFNPAPALQWFERHGVREYGYEELFERHRPALLSWRGAVFLTAVHEEWPRVLDGIAAPLRRDRQAFITRLQAVAPERPLEAMEYHALSAIGPLRQFLIDRPELRLMFPDLLFGDADAFVDWLHEHQGREHFLPAPVIETFAAKAHGRALARVYSCLARPDRWPATELWPLALVGEESDKLARSLLQSLRYSMEIDADDVLMFLWIMEEVPWAGLALTLELPIHATRHPSSRSREGQDQILAPALARDARLAAALAAYRAENPPVHDPFPPSYRTSRMISVEAALNGYPPPSRFRAARSVASGVNVFGYHKSEIGLGRLSRGLVLALEAAGEPASRPILTNVKMDADLSPRDFARAWDAGYGTNVIVSYPHMRELILETIPDEVREGHRNIACLAWEQRGGSPWWKAVYSAFDQVWALSDFAAESLTSVLGRKVHSVPCVVDPSAFPEASTRERHGLDPSETVFLFIFDANSSMVRKNPEAVVDAFRRAFGRDDRARLIIKASNGTSLDHRASMRRLMARIGGHPKIEVRTNHLSRNDLYGLISVCDSYVSLHHAEGFGYTCAEAMACGKPVIATGYSGNMQFMNDQNSYPTRYAEVESEVADGPFPRGSLWAEPDAGHAAELMRRVFECPEEAARKGALGRETILRELSPAAIGARVAGLLRDGSADVSESTE